MTKRSDLERRTELAVFALVAFGKFQERAPEYPRVHTVFSGFNEAFREFFSDEDPVRCMKQLASEGLIEFRLARGGAVYRPSIDLLREPTDEERAIAFRVGKFLTGFLAAHTAAKNGNQKRKPVEEEAEKLFAAGKSVEALRLLGYKV